MRAVVVMAGQPILMTRSEKSRVAGTDEGAGQTEREESAAALTEDRALPRSRYGPCDLPAPANPDLIRAVRAATAGTPIHQRK